MKYGILYLLSLSLLWVVIPIAAEPGWIPWKHDSATESPSKTDSPERRDLKITPKLDGHMDYDHDEKSFTKELAKETSKETGNAFMVQKLTNRVE